MGKPAKALYSNTVYWEIIDRIHSGQLQAGAILGETQLAKELQISRSPVRTAIAKLVAEGILSHTERGVSINDILVTPERYKLLTEVVEAFLIIVIQKAPSENYNWPRLNLRAYYFNLKLLAAKEAASEFTATFHLFLLEVLAVSENYYFVEYCKRNFFLIEQFGMHLPIFKAADTRIWSVNQLEHLLNQLASEQTDLAIQTVRTLFRELQVQAYRK